MVREETKFKCLFVSLLVYSLSDDGHAECIWVPGAKRCLGAMLLNVSYCPLYSPTKCPTLNVTLHTITIPISMVIFTIFKKHKLAPVLRVLKYNVAWFVTLSFTSFCQFYSFDNDLAFLVYKS